MWYCIFLWLLWCGHAVHGSIEYKSGTGLSASTYKMITYDGLVDSNYITTLSGSVPNTTSATNIITRGFSSLYVTQFNKSDGSLNTAGFNSSTGYTELTKNNIAGDSLDFSSESDILFVPGAIVSDGTDYYIFASARKLSSGGSGASKIFMTKISSDGTIDTSFNSGGTKDLISILGAAFPGGVGAAFPGGGGSSGTNALYTFNKAYFIPSTDRILVIGSIMEDPETSSSYITKGFITLLQTDGTVLQATPLIDMSNHVEIYGITMASGSIFVCGYRGTSSIVTKYTYNPSSGPYLQLSGALFQASNTVTLASNSKAWDVKQLGSHLFIGATNTSGSPQSINIYSINPSTLAYNTGFNSTGSKSYTFAPYGSNPNVAQNAYLRLAVDSTNSLIYLCGSIYSYSTSFIYKLNSSGAEQDFAYNGAGTGTDIYGWNYSKPTASPIWYINQASVFTSSLHGLFQAALDPSDPNRLFLFGTTGSVTKSPGFDSLSSYTSSSDYVLRVDLDKDITSVEYQQPIWGTGSVQITLANSYTPDNQSNIDVAEIDSSTTINGPSLGSMVLASDTLSITQPDTSGNLNLFGAVDVTENDVTTLVALRGYIPVTVSSDATINTIGTGVLYGAYNNGYIIITVTSVEAPFESIAGETGPTETTLSKNAILNITNTYSSSSAIITGNSSPQIISIDGDDSIIDEYTTITLSAPTINKVCTRTGLNHILISTTATLSTDPEIEIPLYGFLVIQVNQNFTIKTPPQGFILRGSITIGIDTLHLEVFVPTINVNQ